MKIKFKVLTLCLAVIMTLGLIAGCANESGTAEKFESDLQYIKDKGTLIVGYTEIFPLNYQDEDGNLTGFETEMAKSFAKKLGVNIEFVAIDPAQKVTVLENKTVDVLWGGLALNDDLKEDMGYSHPYCENVRAIVMKADVAEEYSSLKSMKKLRFAVGQGTAGVEIATEKGFTFDTLDSQVAALEAVLTQKNGAAIVDLFTAAFITTDERFEGLTIKNTFDGEQYVVGFRRSSDLAAEVNNFLIDAYKNGNTSNLAEKFGIAQAVSNLGGFLAFWNAIVRGWYTFCEQFPIVFGALNEGFVQTLKLFFVTLIGALPLGLLISFCSMNKFTPLRKFTRMIIWIVRGSPLMLQLMIVFYGPGLLLGIPIWGGGDNGRFMAASVAFIVNYACYFSEIFRSGIESVPHGQYEAGQVLGMTKPQIFFKVTLLQMVKRILPPMSNEIITLVKDTSLARIIALHEIIWMGEAFTTTSHDISGLVWPLFFTGVYYLAFNGLLTILFSKLEKKLDYFTI